MRSGDKREHSLASTRRSVAAVREEELRIARRAQVEAVDACDAGALELQLGGTPEVEPAGGYDRVAEAFAVRARNLVADLVAARADRGPDCRRDVAAERPGGLAENPAED